MKLDAARIEIINNLVGSVTAHTAEMMSRNLDCFLHPKLSLFIPSRGQCEYALTENHTHPAYSFIYYFQPVSDIIVEGRHMSYDLAEGKCLSAMSPEIPHQEVAEDFYQSYIAIVIEAGLFREVLSQYSKAVPLFRGEAFAPHPELIGLLRCFMLESSRQAPSPILDSLVQVITHLTVLSVISDTRDSVPLYDRFEIDRAISYMNSRFSEKITVEELAGLVGLSAGHFSKLFKTVTGDTPIGFLNLLRLQKARIMLINETASLTDIALRCGFNSSSYFSACFLEKYRMTPSAYRQKMQNT